MNIDECVNFLENSIVNFVDVNSSEIFLECCYLLSICLCYKGDFLSCDNLWKKNTNQNNEKDFLFTQSCIAYCFERKEKCENLFSDFLEKYEPKNSSKFLLFKLQQSNFYNFFSETKRSQKVLHSIATKIEKYNHFLVTNYFRIDKFYSKIFINESFSTNTVFCKISFLQFLWIFQEKKVEKDYILSVIFKKYNTLEEAQSHDHFISVQEINNGKIKLEIELNLQKGVYLVCIDLYNHNKQNLLTSIFVPFTNKIDSVKQKK